MVGGLRTFALNSKGTNPSNPQHRSSTLVCYTNLWACMPYIPLFHSSSRLF